MIMLFADVGAQVITTYAGGLSVGDGNPALQAHFNRPTALAVDAAGNRYVSDAGNARIRKISPAGIVTTVAGTGDYGNSPDGTLAMNAQIGAPAGLALDAAGTLYFVDGNRIRKISPSGILTTVASASGVMGMAGDGGPALNAQLNFPKGLALDPAGNLYVADSFNHRIRRITPAGIITTVAGNGVSGFSGDGGQATQASLSFPSDVKFDAAGNMLIADSSNERIRRVTQAGIISTIAGRPTASFVLQGGALDVRLGAIDSIALDLEGNIYTVGVDLNVGKITPSGQYLSVGAGTRARRFFHTTYSIAVDAGNNLLLPDSAYNRVLSVSLSTPNPAFRVVAGVAEGGADGDGGPALGATFYAPGFLAVDHAGNVYVADTGRNRVRKVDTRGVISAFAGSGTYAYASGDNAQAVHAGFAEIQGLATDALGNVYVSDRLPTLFYNVVRRIRPDGIVTAFAGGGNLVFGNTSTTSIPATTVLLQAEDLASDVEGNVFIGGPYRIHKVTPGGQVSRYLGNVLQSNFSGDGGPAGAAGLKAGGALATDSLGNVFLVDSQRIRKVDRQGVIRTIAGQESNGSFGDGNLATLSALWNPSSLAVDGEDNLFIADGNNYRIRKINRQGIMSTVVGTGVSGFSGDGGPAKDAQIGFPSSIAMDKRGNLFIADGRRVRKVAGLGSPVNYQGAWGNSEENGWGLAIIQHGDTLVAGWYYYDGSGRSTWTIMPGCTWNTEFTDCEGQLFNSTGAAFSNYTAAQFSQSPVGTMKLSFRGSNSATMTYSVNGVTGQKALSKLIFVNGSAPSSTNYGDIWWGGANQNGWGVALIQQEAEMVGSWYTYDDTGKATWYLINGGRWTASTTYSANLIQASGSALLGTSYDASRFSPAVVGTITFNFTSGSSGTMTYTVNGVTQSKAISRLQF